MPSPTTVLLACTAVVLVLYAAVHEFGRAMQARVDEAVALELARRQTPAPTTTHSPSMTHSPTASMAPTPCTTAAEGNVTAVHTVEVAWEKNENGQFVPKPVPGTNRVLPAQLVLLAMGFLGPEQPLLEALGVERDARSNIKADHGAFTTNLPGVFAAGDCRRGQSLVVWAFNEGRGAARECDRYLMGATDLP